MMKDLFDALDHALFGQTGLLLVIKTTMMSVFANECRRSELFLKVGHFNPNLELSREMFHPAILRGFEFSRA